MSSRTLWCEIGKHNFEHPGGRGRPPKNCSEHKPEAKPKASTIKSNQQAAKENPFIKKATGNPFIDKAERNPQQELAEHQKALLEHSEKRSARKAKKLAEDMQTAATEAGATPLANSLSTHIEQVGEEEEFGIDYLGREAEAGKPKIKKTEKPDARRSFKKPTYTEVVDTETHHSADLAGVKISNLKRDTTGVWTCTLTVGDEAFNLVRRGGWQIYLDDGRRRFAKPNVAAVIQAFVQKLEKSDRQNQKTLEAVADEVVPLPETHEDKVDKPKRGRRTKIEQPSKTCDCCDRSQKPGEDNWVVDPDEGVDLCPECAEALEVFPAAYAAEPEQVDDSLGDMADAFSALDFELGDS